MQDVFILAGRFTLGKNERIKSRSITEEIFSSGKKFSTGFFRIHYKMINNGEYGLLFGTGASTKNFKNATDRNRIKRLIREAYRLQKNPLRDILVNNNKTMAVFFIYTGKEIPGYQLVLETMRTALIKLQTLANPTD